MDSIVLEQPSSSTPCSDRGGGGGRAIDRHNPIIRDEKRLGQSHIFPSSSTITITTTTTTTTVADDQSHLGNHKPEVEGGDQKRKSVAFANDDELLKASDFISPASSSRCLLSDIDVSYSSSEFHRIPSPSPPLPPHEHFKLAQPPPPSPPISCDGLKPPQSLPHEPVEFHNSKHNSLSSATTKPPSPPCPPPSSNQVVVLEVALHCRGCERKMKKHISKIEGVTSFKIEFAAKKVTVVGDVTPLAVLTSVLKVKNAKLLTPASISSSAAAAAAAQIGSNGS